MIGKRNRETLFDNERVRFFLRRLIERAATDFKKMLNLTVSTYGDNWQAMWQETLPRIQTWPPAAIAGIAEEFERDVRDAALLTEFTYLRYVCLGYGKDAYGKKNRLEVDVITFGTLYRCFINRLARTAEMIRGTWFTKPEETERTCANALSDALHDVSETRVRVISPVAGTARNSSPSRRSRQRGRQQKKEKGREKRKSQPAATSPRSSSSPEPSLSSSSAPSSASSSARTPSPAHFASPASTPRVSSPSPSVLSALSKSSGSRSPNPKTSKGKKKKNNNKNKKEPSRIVKKDASKSKSLHQHFNADADADEDADADADADSTQEKNKAFVADLNSATYFKHDDEEEDKDEKAAWLEEEEEEEAGGDSVSSFKKGGGHSVVTAADSASQVHSLGIRHQKISSRLTRSTVVAPPPQSSKLTKPCTDDNAEGESKSKSKSKAKAKAKAADEPRVITFDAAAAATAAK